MTTSLRLAWNHYPNWTPVVDAAGFGVTQSVVTTIASVTPVVREFAKRSDENPGLTGRTK
ncbi:hypothetical protein BMF89_01760 [Arthrobacter sp. SRS-W-1-2016]|uniref:hypothetical protein n=1 Tax=Arthrobacter TaxID=1663 RepID=UPI000990EAF9|nr:MULTISPECIES: hypothetical protein [Arthrobacter]MDQ0212425.1 hypothetical protein [Arthrobacter bambusae]MDQ0236873.1 hypothetical protein [Arthrobacter bambusae]OOP64887.1 hypothetical protein BMF89_01760 [Arthrobacter sp. SRS-W-1-2016]